MEVITTVIKILHTVLCKDEIGIARTRNKPVF